MLLRLIVRLLDTFSAAPDDVWLCTVIAGEQTPAVTLSAELVNANLGCNVKLTVNVEVVLFVKLELHGLVGEFVTHVVRLLLPPVQLVNEEPEFAVAFKVMFVLVTDACT